MTYTEALIKTVKWDLKRKGIEFNDTATDEEILDLADRSGVFK